MADAPTFPPALQRFVALFNAGRCFESHEVLERAWAKNRSPFYKGLIIYASAFVHLQRGNPSGVAKQLGKVPRYLSAFRPCYLGLDVAAILAHAARVRRDGEARGVRGLSAPPLVLRASLCAGTEAELEQADGWDGERG